MSKTDSTLYVADGLEVPVDIATETTAVVGRRGTGKTSLGVVVAEELAERNVPFVVIDPLGVWWGLRSSADGTGDGYPVVILGGDHGDLPLPEDSGSAVADLIVSEPRALILDLSHMRKAKQRTFVTGLLERLFEKNRAAVHLFLDEADMWAPQRPMRGAERMLGAAEDIVRRGRARGLGATLITQRPASLHKDVMNQASTLVTFQLTGPTDRKAVDTWVRSNADEEQRNLLIETLPTLAVGEAWWWSPARDVFKRVQVRRRHTYDSSSTPKVGAGRAAGPERYAPVDFDAVAALLQDDPDDDAGDGKDTGGKRTRSAASAVPKADRAETAALRSEVAALKQRLAEAEAAEPEVVEVPALTDEDRQGLEHLADALEDVRDQLRELARDADELVGAATGSLAQIAVVLSEADDVAARTERATVPRSAVPAPDDATDPDDVSLRAGERRMLAALATPVGVRRTRAQVASLARLKSSSGTFSTYWSTLRTNGLITEVGPDLWAITDAGAELVPDRDVVAAPTSTDDVVAVWSDALRAGERRMLDAVLDAHPDPLTRDELADRAGLEPSSGTFSTYLSTLRSNGLVDVDRQTVSAADVLFPLHYE